MKVHEMARMILSAAAVAAGLSASADVFDDCTAWYIGGSSTVGAFKNGDMTDIRHAAIADSPTHGGTLRPVKNTGTSNLCENVYSVASGRWFENQRTIYLAQRETTSGDYKVYENGVTLPFAATNTNYTLLMRVKLDEAQPHNQNWVDVVDLGYSGGNDSANRYAFKIRYTPKTEEIGFLFNNGSGKKYFAPTNDVCQTLREKWLELSVSLELLSQTAVKDVCRMRIGVAAEGMERNYYSWDYEFPKGQSVPRDGKINLGSDSAYGGASPKCTPARGSYQMISYWDRVLTDDEILEAFKRQGPDATATVAPALLKYGDPAWSDEVFGGTIEGAKATVGADLQDIGKFPSAIAAGQTLELPFDVPATCTNLRQVVRLTAFASSSPACVEVSIDGGESEMVRVKPGQQCGVSMPASFFTEGRHTLALKRVDSETKPLRLSAVEISGSWRLGLIDGSDKPFADDSGKAFMSSTIADLTTNGWAGTRGTIKTTSTSAIRSELIADLNAEDVAKRTMTLRVKPCSANKESSDLLVLANNAEVLRKPLIYSGQEGKDDVSNRYVQVSIPFKPGTLAVGQNAFLFKLDRAYQIQKQSPWLKFDYYELEVGKDNSGMSVIVK